MVSAQSRHGRADAALEVDFAPFHFIDDGLIQLRQFLMILDVVPAFNELGVCHVVRIGHVSSVAHRADAVKEWRRPGS